jgi:hypothetical protein
LPNKDTINDIIINYFLKKKTQNKTTTHLHGFVIFCLIKKIIKSIIMSWGSNISLLEEIRKTGSDFSAVKRNNSISADKKQTVKMKWRNFKHRTSYFKVHLTSNF